MLHPQSGGKQAFLLGAAAALAGGTFQQPAKDRVASFRPNPLGPKEMPTAQEERMRCACCSIDGGQGHGLYANEFISVRPVPVQSASGCFICGSWRNRDGRAGTGCGNPDPSGPRRLPGSPGKCAGNLPQLSAL